MNVLPLILETTVLVAASDGGSLLISIGSLLISMGSLLMGELPTLTATMFRPPEVMNVLAKSLDELDEGAIMTKVGPVEVTGSL